MDILTEQNPGRKLQKSLFLANMPADSDDSFLDSSQRNTSEQRAVSPCEQPGGAPGSPTAEATEDPCDPLARACLLHFRTVGSWLSPGPTTPSLHLFLPCGEEPPRDASPGQGLGQALPQRRKWWCRGPEPAGGRLSSEQTRRDAKRRKSAEQSLSHPSLPTEKHKIQKLGARKPLRVHGPSLLLRWKCSCRFPRIQFPGFCLDSPSGLAELTASRGSPRHQEHSPDVLSLPRSALELVWLSPAQWKGTGSS